MSQIGLTALAFSTACGNDLKQGDPNAYPSTEMGGVPCQPIIEGFETETDDPSVDLWFQLGEWRNAVNNILAAEGVKIVIAPEDIVTHPNTCIGGEKMIPSQKINPAGKYMEMHFDLPTEARGEMWTVTMDLPEETQTPLENIFGAGNAFEATCFDPNRDTLAEGNMMIALDNQTNADITGAGDPEGWDCYGRFLMP